MNSFDSIPGNIDVLNSLSDKMTERKIIGMLGAGCSMPTWPSWSEVVSELITDSRDSGEITADLAKFLNEKNSEPEYVVEKLAAELKLDIFQAKLQKIFSKPPNTYTDQHEALAKLNFRALVTTNFDLGIRDALIESGRTTSTSYYTFSNSEAISAINSNEYDSLGDRPLIYQHGVIESPNSIVFSKSGYVDQYNKPSFQRAFERLWSIGPLLFVGFSFTDKWIEIALQKAADVLSIDMITNPRHFAIMPLFDTKFVAQRRAELQERFGVRAVFYHPQENHRQLLEVLDRLPRSEVVRPVEFSGPSYKFGKNYFHETTNDHRYVARKSDYLRLSKFALDSTTSVIGVTGIGGQGKTSLIGSWLKKNGGDVVRDFDGLFYWSLYNNRDPEDLFRKIIDHSGSSFSGQSKERTSGLSARRKEQKRVDVVLSILKEHKILLVLDGLEVIQDNARHSSGKFIVDDIRDLLMAACRKSHKSLIILTSRFLFTDLEEYQGQAFKAFQLGPLSKSVVSMLLEQFSISNLDNFHARIAMELEGHPLAIRLFVAAFQASNFGDPGRLLKVALSNQNIQSLNISKKIHNILNFYDSAAPELHREILGSVALFDEPERVEIIGELAKASTDKDAMAEFTEAIAVLSNLGLVLVEEMAGESLISCHPVLRDFFRTNHLSSNQDSAGSAARLLEDRPGENVPRSIQSLKPLSNAISVLQSAGFHERAYSIYKNRMREGFVFYAIPAFGFAEEIASGFFRNKTMRELKADGIRPRDVETLYIQQGEFLAYVGDAYAASNVFTSGLAQHISSANKLVVREKFARVLTEMGRLDEAQLQLTATVKQLDRRTRLTFAISRARIAAYKGEGSLASTSLASLDLTDREAYEEPEYLATLGAYEAEVLSLFGSTTVVNSLLRRSLGACLDSKTPGLEAHILIVWAEYAAESRASEFKLRSSEKAIDLCRGSQNLLLLPRAVFAHFNLVLSRIGLKHVPDEIFEGINFARKRELKLTLIRGLLLRARIYVNMNEVELARADVDEAYELSRDTKYVWGTIAAEHVYARIEKAIGNKLESERHIASWKALTRRYSSGFDFEVQTNIQVDIDSAVMRLKEAFSNKKP